MQPSIAFHIVDLDPRQFQMNIKSNNDNWRCKILCNLKTPEIGCDTASLSRRPLVIPGLFQLLSSGTGPPQQGPLLTARLLIREYVRGTPEPLWEAGPARKHLLA